MKQSSLILVLAVVILAVAATGARADLLDCNEERFVALPDLSGIGPKTASAEDSSGEHEVRDFFKSVGCQIKKGASKVKEQAKKFGTELKEGAKKLGEKAKNLGSDIKTKFDDFKERLAHDDSVEQQTHHGLLATVEIINPDILKAEQICGHGHILDALGNCSKLRK